MCSVLAVAQSGLFQCLKVAEAGICHPNQRRINWQKGITFCQEFLGVPSLPAHPDHGSGDGEDVSAVRSPADTRGDGYGSMTLGFETCHSRGQSSPGAVQLLLAEGREPSTLG